MNLLTWLLYTCISAFVILTRPLTTNAEIFSVLTDRDVVVDLFRSDGQKMTVHDRIGKKNGEENGFRKFIPLAWNVRRAHIVHGDSDIVCEVWAQHGPKSREFSPTVAPVPFDPVVKGAYYLRCWLSMERAKGKKGKGMKAVPRGGSGAVGKPTLDEVVKAWEEKNREEELEQERNEEREREMEEEKAQQRRQRERVKEEERRKLRERERERERREWEKEKERRRKEKEELEKELDPWEEVPDDEE